MLRDTRVLRAFPMLFLLALAALSLFDFVVSLCFLSMCWLCGARSITISQPCIVHWPQMLLGTSCHFRVVLTSKPHMYHGPTNVHLILTSTRTQMLQNDLHKLYKLADTNNMKFNANKFDLLLYGKRTGNKICNNLKIIWWFKYRREMTSQRSMNNDE